MRTKRWFVSLSRRGQSFLLVQVHTEHSACLCEGIVDKSHLLIYYYVNYWSNTKRITKLTEQVKLSVSFAVFSAVENETNWKSNLPYFPAEEDILIFAVHQGSHWRKCRKKYSYCRNEFLHFFCKQCNVNGVKNVAIPTKTHHIRRIYCKYMRKT